ncbi:MAG: sugar phosphate isomerase/epimerase family protein [Phycisphaeraceae bacterium]
MSAPFNNLGVQSYCFRGFKENAKVAELVKEIGLSAIEICGVHADFNDPPSFDNVIKTYRDAGVDILAIGVQTFTGDTDKERQWFEFAKKAGAKYISAHFNPDTWEHAVKKTSKLCDEYGIQIALHNHGGYQWMGSSDMLSHIFKSTGKQIGLCMDTAWCLDAGEDPIKWAEKFGDRLYGLHIKDFIFHRNRKQEDVVVGTGNLDLPKLIEKCNAADFNGYAVLEYEGDVDNPVPALKKCVEQVRNAVK